MTDSLVPVRLFQANATPAMEAAATEVLRSGQIASGSYVSQFEDAFGQLVGRQHVVAVNDMTSALMLALELAGVRPGDEVLTLAFSCMSSNSAIHRVGATPVWVDIDPKTASISLEDLDRAVTPRVKALTLYHVAGYPAAMEDVVTFCRNRGIAVIEDCNAALGACVGDRQVGQFGDFAVFSFYPNRQINALEGGALACPDHATALRARRLRRFGIDLPTFRNSIGEINAQSDIPEIGLSASFSNMNAAIALAQISDVPEHQARTASLAERMIGQLAEVPDVVPVYAVDNGRPSYWGCLALISNRDARLGQLKAAGVQASVLHYRNDRYSGFHSNRSRELPGTDYFMERIVALPCGWWLSEVQVDLTVRVLAETGQAT